MDLASPENDALAVHEERVLVPSNNVLEARAFCNDEVTGFATQSSRNSMCRQQAQCNTAQNSNELHPQCIAMQT